MSSEDSKESKDLTGLTRENLHLKEQPVWQLTLELSATRRKLRQIEEEIHVLGEEKSGRALETRDLLTTKISALQEELGERTKRTLLVQ